MFLNRGISTSIKNYSEQIDRLKSAMKEADAVIVGAGAGLSQREGIATLAADEAISGSRLLSR